MPNTRLETSRLRLRPMAMEDAPDVYPFMLDPEIAANTALIPYPYPPGAAEGWIQACMATADHGEEYTFAIRLKQSDGGDRFIGAIGIGPDGGFPYRGQIGYWLGKPYWGQGYMSEAARRVIRFGFEELGMHRIYATHFDFNPASGRVMQKAGMRYEGTQRGFLLKDGRWCDAPLYAILRTDEAAAGL